MELTRRVKHQELLAGSFLLEFESPKEVERVLERGVIFFENKMLLLEKWKPDLGCFWVGPHARKAWVWVWVGGLPL